MQRDYSLNLKLWGSSLAVLAGAVVMGGLTTLQSVERLSANVKDGIDHSQQLTDYERRGAEDLKRYEISKETNAAYVDSIKGQTGGLNIPDYVCDPNTPPSYQDWNLWANGKQIPVTDRYNSRAGFITPDGAFIFEPACQ